MTIQHVVTGAGAPASAPPSIGAHYVNTANGDQYLAKGTASAADWVFHSAVGPKGEDGVGVASAAVDEQGHLILAMTDSNTIDAGPLPSLGGVGDGALTAGTLVPDQPRVVAASAMALGVAKLESFFVTVPEEVMAGDLLLLFLASYGPVTVPAGWSLYAQGATEGGETLTIYSRTAQSGDSGADVELVPEEGWNDAWIAALRGSQPLAIIGHQLDITNYTVSWVMPMASATATAGGQLAVAAIVHDYWYTDGYLGYADGEWTDLTQTGTTPELDNGDRFLHVASKSLIEGEQSIGNVIDTGAMESARETMSTVAATLLIGYAE